MEKLNASKTFLKMAGGRMYTPYPSPPGSAPGHKPPKPSKESGIFQQFSHLAPLILFFFTERQSQGGAWHNALPPKYAPAVKSKNSLLFSNVL